MSDKPMLAYHNDPAIKVSILAQLAKHRAADELVKGRYWRDGKGCAVGCTLHSSDHAEYEPRFGIPQMLARLEDRIFEALPNDLAQEWPIRFMSAIIPGSDLSHVGWQFLHWLITNEAVNPGINHPLVRDAVKQCADVIFALTKGESITRSAASAAASAAWSAAWSAESASESAAESAAWSAESAAWSAKSAAESAAWSAESAAESAKNAGSAESAAWSAKNAAESAAWSAESAAESAKNAAWSATTSAASAATSAAWSAAYVLMSDKLIALIKAAPCPLKS